MTKTAKKQSNATKPGAKKYQRPLERGLGVNGGSWNLRQAAEWCGIGENNLRTMAKKKQIPCAYFIGRRIIVPREGFKDWFNRRGSNSAT